MKKSFKFPLKMKICTSIFTVLHLMTKGCSFFHQCFFNKSATPKMIQSGNSLSIHLCGTVRSR